MKLGLMFSGAWPPRTIRALEARHWHMVSGREGDATAAQCMHLGSCNDFVTCVEEVSEMAQSAFWSTSRT